MSEDTKKIIYSMMGVNKSYNSQKIIKDISLSYYYGAKIGVLGLNGSGKSTLMHCMAGLDEMTQGSVTIADIDIASLKDKELTRLRRDKIGFVFQSFNLVPTLTADENIRLPLLLGNNKGNEEWIQKVINTVHLQDRLTHRPSELSGGQQQRVALARAMAPRPGVLLMDEPFSGLDNRLRDGVRDETLAILKSEDTAVLLVTHEPEEAMRMADEIALMRAGRIVQSGAPYNIYNAPVDRAAVAVFSDANVIKSRVTGALAETPFGQFFAPGLSDGTKVDIVVRPQHVRIDFDRQGKGPNPTPSQGVAALGHVIRSRFLGSESLVEFRMAYDGSVLKASIPSVFLPKPEQPMWLTIPRDRCFIFEVTL